MKKIISATTIAILLFGSVFMMASCDGNDAANAENKDTVSTYIEPKPDNTIVRPDTMQTQVPQDSAAAKGSMK